MAAITAGMVGELRAKTDAPMMECKKALTEADGDMVRAEEILRVKLGNKAGKAASRITAEGVIAITAAGTTGAMIEVNCETDFVSKNDSFLDFTKNLAGLIAEAFSANHLMPAMEESWKNGKDVFLRGAPHLLIAHAGSDAIMPAVDWTIALSYFEIVAAAYGIGTCWAGVMGIAASKHPPLLQALKLPNGPQVCGAMMFGYPKYRYRRVPLRKAARISWR